MNLSTLTILIGIVAMMFVGQTVYTSDLEYNNTRDIYNFTEEKININYSFKENIANSFEKETNLEEYNINTKRIVNIFGAFMEFAVYSFSEVLKGSIEYGYTHPEQDLKFFLDFLIKIFLILIVIALIPLIIPLLAIICILGKGIIYLYKRTFKKQNDI